MKRVAPSPDDFGLVFFHFDPKLPSDVLARFLEVNVSLRNATLEFAKKGGAGYARLASQETVAEAVKLNNRMVEGVRLFVEEPRGTDVYFGGFPPDFDELCLRGFCAKEAELSVRAVRSVRMVPPPRPGTAAGIVTFTARCIACQAIVRLNGQYLDRAPVIVAWKSHIDEVDSTRQLPDPHARMDLLPGDLPPFDPYMAGPPGMMPPGPPGMMPMPGMPFHRLPPDVGYGRPMGGYPMGGLPPMGGPGMPPMGGLPPMGALPMDLGYGGPDLGYGGPDLGYGGPPMSRERLRGPPAGLPSPPRGKGRSRSPRGHR